MVGVHILRSKSPIHGGKRSTPYRSVIVDPLSLANRDPKEKRKSKQLYDKDIGSSSKRDTCVSQGTATEWARQIEALKREQDEKHEKRKNSYSKAYGENNVTEEKDPRRRGLYVERSERKLTKEEEMEAWEREIELERRIKGDKGRREREKREGRSSKKKEPAVPINIVNALKSEGVVAERKKESSRESSRQRPERVVKQESEISGQREILKSSRSKQSSRESSNASKAERSESPRRHREWKSRVPPPLSYKEPSSLARRDGRCRESSLLRSRESSSSRSGSCDQPPAELEAEVPRRRLSRSSSSSRHNIISYHSKTLGIKMPRPPETAANLMALSQEERRKRELSSLSRSSSFRSPPFPTSSSSSQTSSKKRGRGLLRKSTGAKKRKWASPSSFEEPLSQERKGPKRFLKWKFGRKTLSLLVEWS